jgi:hypothetical protein
MAEDYEPVVTIPTQWAPTWLVFLAMILSVELGKENLLIALPMAIGLLIVSLPLLIYGLITTRQYKNVFDYEPTVFWRKESNGKKVRAFLMTCNYLGLYCLIVGGILLLYGLPIMKLLI